MKIKLCTGMLLGVALLLVACGGSSNPSSNTNTGQLTQAQAQQLGTEAFTQAFKAVEDVAGESSSASAVAAFGRSRHFASDAAPDVVSCSGSTCTITSVVYKCQDGGAITVNGSVTETSSSSGNLSLTLAPASCSDGTLVINGSPDLTINAQASDNGTTATLAATLGGGVAYSPVQTGAFPSGSCSSNLSANVAINVSSGQLSSCSLTGSICGYNVSVTTCPE
ncbi:MAG TPA: hypothetical protein VF753_18565 [Terriglobales bacterium]